MERLFLFTPRRRKVEQDLRASDSRTAEENILISEGCELTRFAHSGLQLKIFLKVIIVSVPLIYVGRVVCILMTIKV